MKRNDILYKLKTMEDIKYKEFQKKLIPNIDEEKMIGIRTPNLRKYAKSLIDDNPQKILNDIFNTDKEELFYEERVLTGLLIGYMENPIDEWKSNVLKFVEIIDNWAVCDVACNTIKVTKEHKTEVWDFLQRFLNDEREYHIRFGVVMSMSHFIDEEYIDRLLEIFENIKVEDYYAMMAVAWAISFCFVKFEDKTIKLLNSKRLDITTHNKAIQKIRESTRVEREKKDDLLKLKR